MTRNFRGDIISGHDEAFRYAMLSRMRLDCEYYINHPYDKFLWAATITDQISDMKALWESFGRDEKPEWITMEEIDTFEKRMRTALENRERRDKNMREATAEELAMQREQTRNDGMEALLLSTPDGVMAYSLDNLRDIFGQRDKENRHEFHDIDEAYYSLDRRMVYSLKDVRDINNNH